MKHLYIVLSLLITLFSIPYAYWWYYVEYDKDIWKYTKYTEELKFSPEFVNAYKYALDNEITSAESITKANMDWAISRIEMSKMISVYAMNVLWIKPDINKYCEFEDVTKELDAKYKYWVTRACQMWLMWYDSDWKKQDNFNPRKNVTRAQLATVLSRMLNKGYWRTIKNWEPYYDTHLKYLISQWIINDYYKPAPDSTEKRWNVMLMLYRSDNRNVVTVNYEEGYTKIKPGQTYRNKYYWFQLTPTAISWSIISIRKDEEWWGTYITLYAFIPEEKDWYKISNEYWEINEFKDKAKTFKESWLLLFLTMRELIKKWSQNFKDHYNSTKDYEWAINNLTEKDYILSVEPWYFLDFSPYVSKIDSQENTFYPLSWPMWYFNHYEFKNLKWNIVY